MLDRCDRVRFALHDAAKAAQCFGLLRGISRSGLAWEWSGREDLVPRP